MESEQTNPAQIKSPADYILEAQSLLKKLASMDVSDIQPEEEEQEDDGSGQNCCYIYLVSNKWFELWKQKTCFQMLEDGLEVSEANILNDLHLPRLNEDLIEPSPKPENYLESSQENFEFMIQRVVSPLVEDQNVKWVTDEVWQFIKAAYPDSIDIKRVAYKKNNQIHFEFNLTPITLYIFSQSQFREFGEKAEELVVPMTLQISRRLKIGELKTLLVPFIKEFLPRTKLPTQLKHTHLGLLVLDSDKTIQDLVKDIKEEFTKNIYRVDKNVKFDGEMLIHDSTSVENFSHIITPNSTLVVEVRSFSNFKLKARNYIVCDHCEELITKDRIDCECNKAHYCSQRCMAAEENYHLRECEKPEFPKKEESSRMGKVGLKNLGNTCYMNSGLQCLSNTYELSEYFLGQRYQNEKNLDNALGSQCKVLDAYGNLMFQVWHGRSGVVSPNKFKHELGNFHSMFQGYGQHDSQEFISHLLDAIHEDVNQIIKKPYTEAVEWKQGQQDEEVAREAWVTFLKRNCSYLVKLFYGQFRSEIKCPDCSNLSITYDPFQLVSLPVPTTNNKRLSFYVIPRLHSESAMSMNFKIKYSEKSETISLLRSAFAEEHEVPEDSFLITFSAFSLHGYLIPDSEYLSKLVQKSVDHMYKPKVFIYHLTEEEIAMKKQENSILMMGLVKKQLDGRFSYPCYNQFVFVRPEDTVETLYFRQFRKFAHFHNYGQQGITNFECFDRDEPLSEVDAQAVFDTHFKGGPPEQQFFKIIVNEKEELDISDPRTLQSIIDSSSDEDIELFYDKDNRVFKVQVILFNKVEDFCTVSKMKKCTRSNIEVMVSKQAVGEQTSSTNVYDLLDKFVLPEQLDNDNTWYCRECKDHVRAFKKIQIYKVPKIMILHMKKLKSGGYMSSMGGQNHHFVSFPLKGLDMTSYVINQKPVSDYDVEIQEFVEEDNLINPEACKTLFSKESGNMVQEGQEADVAQQEGGAPKDKLIYDCYGVVNHYGNSYFGHYTAYVKKGDSWYCGDDSSFSQIQYSRVVSEAAYVLFYRLREEFMSWKGEVSANLLC